MPTVTDTKEQRKTDIVTGRNGLPEVWQERNDSSSRLDKPPASASPPKRKNITDLKEQRDE